MSSGKDRTAIWATSASRRRLGWMGARPSVVVPGSEGTDSPDGGSWIRHDWHRPEKRVADRPITGVMRHVVSRSEAPTTLRQLERPGWDVLLIAAAAVTVPLPQPATRVDRNSAGSLES